MIDTVKRALTTSASDSQLDLSSATSLIQLKNNESEGCGNAVTPLQPPIGTSQIKSHVMSTQQTDVKDAVERDVDTNMMVASDRRTGVDCGKAKFIDQKATPRPCVDDDKENGPRDFNVRLRAGTQILHAKITQ
jgi:hypothetical protein